MYQTARMLETTLSRTALLVCITRLAMRPAKSFWKKGQLWRTTCQWLCQRIRLVTPGTTMLLRTTLSASSTSGRPSSTSAPIASSIGSACCTAAARSAALHQAHQAADEERDHGVDQRHRQAGDEQGAVQPARLADEVPVEGPQPGRRRQGRARRWGAGARQAQARTPAKSRLEGKAAAPAAWPLTSAPAARSSGRSGP